MALTLHESVCRMAYSCCLAGIDPNVVPMLSSVLRSAGTPGLATIARLDVTAIGILAPDLLVCDVDGADVDRLEMLRQLRFVVPECLIAVYTGVMKQSWCLACHVAGANCLLSKESDEETLAVGIHDAMRSGCYTDPRFAAA
jgi:DNA-binding NarL/FixJ family response regulator